MSGTVLRFRWSWLVAGLLATSCLTPVALLGGCGEESVTVRSDSLGTSVTPAQATYGDETGAGEGPTEAAYTGPYDAELMSVGVGTGRTRTVQLHNRGRRADTYWIAVYPPSAARVSTRSVRLRPDEAATITVMITTHPFVVHVLSRGRKGDDVADLLVS